MKTIDCTPSWMWVASMFIFMIETKSPKHAIKTFEDELGKLGKEVKSYCEILKDKKSGAKERVEAKKKLFDSCRKVDEQIERKKK